MNVNTKDYWDERFGSGDWEEKKGRIQTRAFAKSQIKYLEIPSNFSGSILDFGCGLGDAMPFYHDAYPNAKLYGIDISSAAIEKCRDTYGHICYFYQGSHLEVEYSDVIISSNVFEHLSNDVEIAQHLYHKCNNLYIVVPYKEEIQAKGEHVNSYDENYFNSVGKYAYKIFDSKGWGSQGVELWFYQYPLNLLRILLGKKLYKRKKQIIFHFKK